MKITLTQLHRRLGYYTDLAAQGEKIIIEQSKPYKARFVLKGKKIEEQKKETYYETLKKNIEKYGSGEHQFGKDPIEYQRKKRKN
jgi:hypothetical protein